MCGLLIINPNSTASMTDAILTSAKASAPDGVEIIAWTSQGGPPSIQGAEDGAAAVPPLLKLIENGNGTATGAGFDAIIIACFDDTGLAEAKALSRVPVIGIGEAAYHTARLLGHRFSVVTTLPVSVPVLEANIRANGFGDLCACVRASDVPVLAIESDPDASLEAIKTAAEKAVAEDDVSAIVLGCAGMSGLVERLSALDATVIDGVAAAVHLAHAISNLQRVAIHGEINENGSSG